MPGDLDGLLVVALEQAVAAPLATCRLVDAGARVIKIERPGGDLARGYDRTAAGQSAYFVWLNRGKESIVLDLAQGGDRAVFEAMVARADVLVQNLAPGALGRLGYEPTTLLARNPRLITCSITGYGPDGPRSSEKAYDLIIQVETGLAGITGSPSAAGRVGVSVSDIAAGHNAAEAILRALIGRTKTGRGRIIEIPLFQATADWMNVPLLQHLGGQTPRRVGLAHPSVAPYGAFSCGDGEMLMIAVQNEREWAAFCAHVLDEPGLAHDPRFTGNPARVANRHLLDEIVADALGAAPAAVWVDRLLAARIAHGRISDLDQFARHPHRRSLEVETPAGPVSLTAPAILDGVSDPRGLAVPALDEHGTRLRREFAPAHIQASGFSG
jgi:crotonobetainyl-CoA:carnitine CoA-transferase CaiB-like acyl-CoA transferase